MPLSAGERLSLPLDHPDERAHRRIIARIVNELVQGHANLFGTFSLSLNVASTRIVDTRVTRNSAIVWVPITSDAASEYGNGTIFYSAGALSSMEAFTLTHANNAITDRIFRYCIFG